MFFEGELQEGGRKLPFSRSSSMLKNIFLRGSRKDETALAVLGDFWFDGCTSGHLGDRPSNLPPCDGGRAGATLVLDAPRVSSAGEGRGDIHSDCDHRSLVAGTARPHHRDGDERRGDLFRC